MAKAHKKSHDWWFFLAAIVIPMALVVGWYAVHRFYPRGDSADFMLTAQNAYAKIKQGNWGALYFERSHRPLSYSSLETLALLITEGNVRVSMAICGSFCFIVFLTFAWLCLRKYAEPKLSALVLAFLATLPWMVSTYVNGTADIGYMSAAAAAFYFYLCSENLTRFKPSLLFGILSALAISMRLVEGIAFTGMLFIAAGYRLWKTRKLSPLGPVLAVLCALTTLFFYSIGSADNDLPTTGWLMPLFIQLGAAALLALGAWKEKKSRALLLSVMLSYVGVVLWYTPFFDVLREWVYWTTFNKAMLKGGSRENMGKFTFIAMIFLWTGGTSLVLLAALALVSSIKHRVKVIQDLRIPVLSLLIGLAVLLLLGSSTYNGDNRYYFTGFLVLFSALSIRALTGRAKKIAFAVMFVMLAAHSVYVASLVFGVPSNFSFPFERESLFALLRPQQLNKITPWVLKSEREEDPVVDLVHKISQYFSKNISAPESATKIAFLRGEVENGFDFNRIVEPKAFTVFSNEQHLGLIFEGVSAAQDEDISDVLKRIQSQHSYVLLMPSNVISKHNILEKLGFQTLQRFSFNYEGHSSNMLLLKCISSDFRGLHEDPID